MKLRYTLVLCAFLAMTFPLGTAAAGPQKTRPQIHRVEKGETLSEIAETYGMSVRELKKLNHIRKPRRLKAGARILVRARKPVESSPAEPAALPAAPPSVDAPSVEARTLEASPSADIFEPRFPRELKEMTDTPLVREVKELSEPPGGGAVGIKEKLVAIARKMLDIPYRFGGSSLLGIDCSGYVQKVFSLLDIVLPRTAREQFHLGELVGMDNLSIGDLVFFRTYAKFPSHVGIYLGDNRFIHASSRDRKVTIDSLDAPYYLKRFIGGRRL
ncbi:MAG: LysM peptidoglycan-binding domain-containing NlpC/P60 family protein, partial [Deltaproteobacteria bacterium]|nr:LysM peptidoglycan-binding domain-containing NlpC/P60 family protein [Deltaproteobacteria bacterium]